MTGKSRWAVDDNDVGIGNQRKHGREVKRRAKVERQRKLEKHARVNKAHQQQEHHDSAAINDQDHQPNNHKGSPLAANHNEDRHPERSQRLLRFAVPSWGPCRRVDNFEQLNHIEEGSYGWVSRARETATGEIVALKKLKMDNLNDGLPVTALREIQTLKMLRGHRHIVGLREVVIGDSPQDVFLVMDFIEHDLKTLQEDMTEPFMPSEIKTLVRQLASAIGFLHDHWILHRDLKTSNILMSNRGEIKVADFGMARYVGEPPPPDLTQLVVTLWYRAPELLLGAKQYTSAIDMWSVGCIFGELLTREPLFQGKSEVDELYKIFQLCGLPTATSWPSFCHLPNAQALRLPRDPDPDSAISRIRIRFPFLTTTGADLLSSLLSLNPAARASAVDVLSHPYFTESPRPKATEMFPTFPSKASQERRRQRTTPQAPARGEAPRLEGDMAGWPAENVDFSGIFARREESGACFNSKPR